MPETAVRGEGPRQRCKAGDRDILGARRRVESGGREQRRNIDTKRTQALTQHLAPLAERGLRYGFEELAIAGQRLPPAAPGGPARM